MFNDERLKEIAAMHADGINERLEQLKQISNDIKLAEELLRRMFLSEFEQSYQVDGQLVTFIWARATKNQTWRIHVKFQEPPQFETKFKPLDEMKSRFRLNCMDAIAAFVEYALTIM